MGRFGRHLATKLGELGNEVMVVDKDEAEVNRVMPHVTAAHIGDCMDEDVVRSLGLCAIFDVCFVCISDNFQSSLEITSLLKEAGAHMVVFQDRPGNARESSFSRSARTRSSIRSADMAYRTAIKYSAKNAFDYIEFTPEYAIFENDAPRVVGRARASGNKGCARGTT